MMGEETMNSGGPGMWSEQELKAYWENLHRQRGRVPDAQIVCHAGAPSWLNRHVDRAQRRAFSAALDRCGPVAGGRALDVGCGTGRWSRRLRDHGMHVIGIDISEDAINHNRDTISGVDFEIGDVSHLEFEDGSFDLVASVTVVQHLTPLHQEAAAQGIGRALRPGGHALILENIRDKGVHVSGRRPADWRRLFADAGLQATWVIGYEYDFPLRAVRTIGGIGRRSSGPHHPARVRSPDEGMLARAWRSSAVRSAAWLSAVLDPMCASILRPEDATHMAMVFQKPS